MEECCRVKIYKKINKANRKIHSINNKIKKKRDKGEEISTKLKTKLAESMFKKYYYIFMNNSKFGK